jgi:hypothetical protein
VTAKVWSGAEFDTLKRCLSCQRDLWYESPSTIAGAQHLQVQFASRGSTERRSRRPTALCYPRPEARPQHTGSLRFKDVEHGEHCRF